MRNKRRLFDSYEKRLYETLITNLEKNECLSIAYYLFRISRKVSNSVILENENCTAIVYQLAKSINLLPRMFSVFSSFIDYYIQNGQLTLLEDENSGENNHDRDSSLNDYQSRRRMNYKYEEDEQVSNYCNFNNADECIRDYFRILTAGEKGTYSQLIYNIFFTKSKPKPETFLDKIPARIEKIGRDLSKVEFLKDELNLSENELSYLLFRYRKTCVELFGDVTAAITKNSNELYTNVLDISKNDYHKIIRADGKLRQLGFISEEREISPALIDCLEAQDLSLYFADCVKSIDLTKTYSLDSFSVPEKNTSVYKKMLSSESPVSLLLYGKPGSGKTEYAKALVKTTGKKALIFRNTSELSQEINPLERLNCLLSLSKDDTIIIVDEADSLLSTSVMTLFGSIHSSKNKGVINKMLEGSKNKVIWISNYKSQIDESTLRRFTISYKFESMSSMMLEKITRTKLDAINLTAETKDSILEMISKYKLTGTSVDNIVKAINCMEEKNEENLLEDIEIILKDNSTLLYGQKKMRETACSSYDSSVLNTSIPAAKLLNMLENAERYAEKNPEAGAIRMLFYGLSGTGKTEFARYISQKLGKPILLKRASDILDKYVGGTEENIASAFNEAAENNMILLFDEADSFFADRKKAERNYERTQVNEFLTQLEEFNGIVICTTNLRSIMDPAMQRRFHITVDFKALTEEGIATLMKKYFPDYNFSSSQIHRLSSYDSVTPGDFARLSGTIRFISPDEITDDYIVDELCNIQEEKDFSHGNKIHRIGFAV